MKVTRHPLLLSGKAHRIPADESVIRKLELSIGVLERHADAFGAEFRLALDARAPGLRGFMPDDRSGHDAPLIRSLKRTVELLRDPDQERAHLTDRQTRHATLGASSEHEAVVIELMVRAMERACGSAWSPDFSREWTAALRLISGMMTPRAGEGGAGAI